MLSYVCRVAYHKYALTTLNGTLTMKGLDAPPLSTHNGIVIIRGIHIAIMEWAAQQKQLHLFDLSFCWG